jgi:transcriptional regulator with XRE-family HTH domain
MSTNDAPSSAPGRRLLSDRLREAREYVGLTQDDVARKLGIPRSALSHMESAARKVEALELTQLAKLYQRDLAWFTGERLGAAKVSKDVAYLARAAEDLSPKDRAELSRFADFLKSRARSKANRDE